MANALTKYLKEAIEEVRKVTWPTKKQTTNHTLVVIGITLAVAIFFAVLDFIFNNIIKFII